MILQPTEKELHERGFTTSLSPRAWDYLMNDGFVSISFYMRTRDWKFESYSEETYIYPTSWDDIDNLIRLLTPKE